MDPHEKVPEKKIAETLYEAVIKLNLDIIDLKRLIKYIDKNNRDYDFNADSIAQNIASKHFSIGQVDDKVRELKVLIKELEKYIKYVPNLALGKSLAVNIVTTDLDDYFEEGMSVKDIKEVDDFLSKDQYRSL
jgi:hypothetical protein